MVPRRAGTSTTDACAALPRAAGGGDPPGMAVPATTAEPQPAVKRHNRWIWGSAALALVAIGLLIWALHSQSELDDAQQQVTKLEATAGKDQATDAQAVAAFEDAYKDVATQ